MPNTTRDSVLDRMLTMSRAMDQVLGADGARSWPRSDVWLPPMDCYETAEAYVVHVDLPGVTADAVDVSFEQNTLSIKGTRPATIQRREKEEFRLFSAERLSGDFARSVRLPEYVDGERIDASFTDGVLTITIPKAQAALPRRIAVNVGGQRRVEG